jgi:type VI secretion system secreted protein Hcp
MPGVAFLMLGSGPTIKGESQAVQGAVELDSYSFGASNPANIGSGGLSGGTVSGSDFSFTCEVDSASGAILGQLFSGQPLDTITFTLYESTGSQQTTQTPYVTVTFTNCILTSQAFGGGNQGKATQSISFAYEQIKYAYSSQTSATGQVTNAANAGYNFAQQAVVS